MAFQAVELELVAKLAASLGLEDHGVSRIIIDAQVNNAVMVYVQKFLKTSEVEPLTAVLNSCQRDHVKVTEVPPDVPLTVDEKGCHIGKAR